MYVSAESWRALSVYILWTPSFVSQAASIIPIRMLDGTW